MAAADSRLTALLAAAVPFALPLRRRFRGVDVREGILLEGPSGWGEFAPFDDYTDTAAARWLDSAIEAAYGTWPAALRTTVPVNAIVPALPATDAASLVRAAVESSGCTTVKVKVGDPSLADDEARIAAIRAELDVLLGPGVGRIRIDANAAWDVPQAVQALRTLGAYGLEYVEQPCPTLDELRRLRGRTDVPIAADETVRTSGAPGRLRLRDAVDLAVVKPAPVGGAWAALRLCETLGVPVVFSGAMDSSVGLDAGVAAAAAAPDLPFACGFGTGALLERDVVEKTSLPIDGVLAVRRRHPDPVHLMAAFDRLPSDRAMWWRSRLERAWAAGAGERSGSLVAASA